MKNDLKGQIVVIGEINNDYGCQNLDRAIETED